MATTQARTFPTGMKALAALMLSALAVLGLQVPAAHAATNVDVTVNLTSKSGVPLVGVTIYAYPWANHDLVPYAETITGTAQGGGKYLLSDLVAGDQYALYFDAPSSATTAFDQFYGGTTWIEEATPLSWGANSELNISLATNANISGTVKGSSSKALAGVTVYPWRFDGSRYYKLWQAYATSNASGAYTLRNLEPGSYKIEFAPDNRTGYLGEFSGNTTTFTSATPYYVGLGVTVASSATLTVGGSISGSVALYDNDTDTDYIPDGVTAYAYAFDTPDHPGALDTSKYYASKTTGTSGKWTVAGLPTGNYVVKLYDSYGYFVERYSVNADTVSTATKYSVTAPATKSTGKTTLFLDQNPGQDNRVDLVVSHSGLPVDDDTTTVYIESADGEDTYYELNPFYGPLYSLEDGQYHFAFLPTGTYNVWVDPGDPAIQPYIGTKVVSPAAGVDTWNIALPDASAFAFSTPPSIAETGTVLGTTYDVATPVTTLEPGADVEFSYIWLRDGIPIFGATSPSYTSRGVDVGAILSVLVRADTFGFGSIFEQVVAANPVTQGAAANPIEFPSISAPSTAVLGSKLSARVGTWDQPGLSFSYTWSRDGSTVVGTGSSYVAIAADAGHSISLVVATTAPGRPTGSATATNTVAIEELTTLKLKTKFVVTSTTSGQPAGSRKFSVSKGAWNLPSTTSSYEWFASGVSIPGAISSTLVCTDANCPAERVIEVVVTGTKLGYTPVSTKLVARKVTAKPAMGIINVGGARDVTVGTGILDDTYLIDIGHMLQAQATDFVVPAGAGARTVAYQWQSSVDGVSWTSISKATKSSYTVPSSLLGKHVRLRLTTTFTNLGTYVEYFPAGTVQLNTDLVMSGLSVGIDGEPTYDSKLHAYRFGNWPVSGVAESFQWFECDKSGGATCSDASPLSGEWHPVAGATSPYFTPGIARDGDVVIAVLTGKKAGYVTAIVPSGASPVAGAATSSYMISGPAMTGGFTGGHATVGTKLTAKSGVADVAAATLIRYWEICERGTTCSYYSGWTQIGGGPLESYTYVPTADDLAFGDRIRFTQFAFYDLGGSGASTVDYELVGKSNKQTKAGKVTRSSTTYTVTPGSWASGSGTTFTYDWFVDGALMLDDSTDNFYTAAAGPLYVDITAHKPGYSDATKRVIVLKGAAMATPNPLLDAAVYGDTLQLNAAAYSYNVATTPKLSYQWYSGSSAIKGATKATFKPSTSYIGKALKLKVTFSSSYYNTTSRYTNAVVLSPHPAPTITAAIAGTPTPGTKLTVTTTGVPSGATLSYVWERSSDGVSGWSTVSKSSSYVVTTSDPTKFLRVKLTTKKSGWLSAPTTVSANVQAEYSPAITPSAPVSLSLSKIVPVGVPLTVSAAFTTSGVSVSYEWFRNGISLPGVTGSTWTPTASSFGDDVKVTVTAKKSGYATEVFTTNTVQVGGAESPAASVKPAISGMTGGTTTPKAPQAGDVLSATPGTWNVDGLTFTYQWKLDGVNAPIGTASTFTVPSGSDGKLVTVEVQTYKLGWQGGTALSHPSKPILP